jgi:hypothetical protein
MVYKITWLKDVLGNNYLGVKFDKNFVNKWLLDLKSYIDSDEKYDLFVKNQVNRDRGSYHITVINVMEFNKAVKNIGLDILNKKLEHILDMAISDLSFKGLGTQTRESNSTFYVVVESEMLNEVRKSIGLNEKDLHITLGFNEKDVFGKPKDESTLVSIDSDLTKAIRKKLAETNDWSFIRSIGNYPEELLDKDINIIKQTDSVLTVKVGDDTNLQISYLEGYGLRVVSVYT